LYTISNHIKYEFKHHNAKEDAIACGKIFTKAIEIHGIKSKEDFFKKIKLRPGRLQGNNYMSCSIRNDLDIKELEAQTDKFDMEHDFYKRKVVFTGTLSCMIRKEAMQKVLNVGGLIGDTLTEDTDFLVMGIQDYAAFSDGKESSKTKKAKQLISKGGIIQIIDEDDFVRMIG
jgi:DNA polymerase-3 subunit epsilon